LQQKDDMQALDAGRKCEKCMAGNRLTETSQMFAAIHAALLLQHFLQHIALQ
jgi:hypothetical protein